jgi:hypothetical protein
MNPFCARLPKLIKPFNTFIEKHNRKNLPAELGRWRQPIAQIGRGNVAFRVEERANGTDLVSGSACYWQGCGRGQRGGEKQNERAGGEHVVLRGVQRKSRASLYSPDIWSL